MKRHGIREGVLFIKNTDSVTFYTIYSLTPARACQLKGELFLGFELMALVNAAVTLTVLR